jgi:peptidoglycan hydrolase CwlO-like protein
MKKHIPAFLAAFVMTAFLALAMGVVTVNAFVNKNSAPLADTQTTVSGDQSQVAQLQSLVQQYQDREQQYKDREQQYQQMIQDQQAQLDTANQQIEQFNQFLLFLQSRGVVSVDDEGRVRLDDN